MGEYESSYTRDKHGKIVKVRTRARGRRASTAPSPGFIMPAQPKVGLDYYQEHLPGVALDSAKITAVDLTLNVEGKVYHHVVLTREFSQLEPTVVDYKWYAPGVGMVLEREVRRGKLDAYSYFTGTSSNGGGTGASASTMPTTSGSPRSRLRSPRPFRGALTVGEAIAYTGLPAAFPVDGHARAGPCASLF